MYIAGQRGWKTDGEPERPGETKPDQTKLETKFYANKPQVREGGWTQGQDGLD
jgi:hypothetical protein